MQWSMSGSSVKGIQPPVSVSTTSTSVTNVVNLNGSGRLRAVYLSLSNVSGTNGGSVTITVDGVIAITYTMVYNASATYISVLGNTNADLNFKQSLLVQIQSQGTTQVNCTVYYEQ